MTMHGFIALGLAAGIGLLVAMGSLVAPYFEAGVRYIETGRKPCDEPKSRICGQMWYQKHA